MQVDLTTVRPITSAEAAHLVFLSHQRRAFVLPKELAIKEAQAMYHLAHRDGSKIVTSSDSGAIDAQESVMRRLMSKHPALTLPLAIQLVDLPRSIPAVMRMYLALPKADEDLGGEDAVHDAAAILSELDMTQEASL